MRARVHLTFAAVSMMALAWMLTGPVGIASAAVPDPLGCASGTIAEPVHVAAGTTFYMHNGFNGTHSSVGPSIISMGVAGGAQTAILGQTTSSCTLNGLSYNTADAYLYAFEADEVVTSSAPASATFVRIGIDAAGVMAVEPVGVVDVSGGGGVSPTTLSTDVGDFSSSLGTLLVPASYQASGATALTDLDNFKPYVVSTPLGGGASSSVAQSYDTSCVPYLQNYVGQVYVYVNALTYFALAGQPVDQVEPEGSFQDWSVNPADGQLYAYASVDARKSSYASSTAPGTPGRNPDNTQSYLGSTITIPPLSWLPAGVAGTVTIQSQSDWILKIDPTTGATTCAAAGDPAASGTINLPNDPGFSAVDPRYDGVGAFTGGGGTEISGSGFSADNVMQLFDSEQARHFTLDVSSCLFGSSAPSCAPTLDATALPGGRERGDGAATPFQYPVSSVSATPALAATGVEVGAPLAFGVLLLTAGLVALRVRRKRTRPGSF